MPQSRVLVSGLVALSFGAGATDAFAFLCLSGIFSANMTGNLVLIGLFQRPGYLQTLVGASAAVVAFAAAAYFCFRLVQASAGVAAGLAMSVAAQMLVLGGWSAVAGHPAPWLQVVLVMLSSVAMGAQTAVSRTVAPPLTTTYVTGTLISVLEDAAKGRGGKTLRLVTIAALVAGAFAGAALIGWLKLLGPALPFLSTAVGTALVLCSTSTAVTADYKQLAASTARRDSQS
jgi:uncharacterized membrane protein YoaK (UPF0700 family)